MQGYFFVSLMCSNYIFLRSDEEDNVARIVSRMIPGAISISAKTIGQQATVTITIADITEFLSRVNLDAADEPAVAEPDAPDPEPVLEPVDDPAFVDSVVGTIPYSLFRSLFRDSDTDADDDTEQD